jgi:hypothetical protein
MNNKIITLSAIGLLGLGMIGGATLVSTSDVVSADTNYQKKDNKTIVVTTPVDLNIESIKKELTDLQVQKDRIAYNCSLQNNGIDEKIDSLESLINEAKKLGIE